MENNRIPRALFRSEILIAPINVSLWMFSCAGQWWYPNQMIQQAWPMGHKGLSFRPLKTIPGRKANRESKP